MSGAKSRISGLLEPCPLKELPKVDSVYICAAQDQAVRPEWQQQAARESLGIDAIVISVPGTARSLALIGAKSRLLSRKVFGQITRAHKITWQAPVA
jgi:hypothetical protein